MTRDVWTAVFGTDHPVEIEIGPGRGDVIVAFAEANPDTNFYGIEMRRSQADRVNARLAARGLRNAFVLAADARCVVTTLVPDASVAAYHVYFPDPWPKSRHHRRRIFQPDLAAGIARTLVPDGLVHFATDLAWVFADGCTWLEGAGFVAAAVGDARPRPITKFEHKYADGRTHARVYRRPDQAEAGSPSPQKTS